jgi:hypothetical protein
MQRSKVVKLCAKQLRFFINLIFTILASGNGGVAYVLETFLLNEFKMRGSVRLGLERNTDCQIYVLKTDHAPFFK